MESFKGIESSRQKQNVQKVVAPWDSGTSRSLGGLAGTEPFSLSPDCWPSPRTAELRLCPNKESGCAALKPRDSTGLLARAWGA